MIRFHTTEAKTQERCIEKDSTVLDIYNTIKNSSRRSALDVLDLEPPSLAGISHHPHALLDQMLQLMRSQPHLSLKSTHLLSQKVKTFLSVLYNI